MQYQWLEGLPGLESMLADWQCLDRTAPSIYSRYEWHSAVAAVLPRESLRWLRVLDGAETAAIVPMYRSQCGPFDLLEVLSLGPHPLLELNDFPLHPNAAAAEVSDAVSRALSAAPEVWHALRWPRMLCSSAAAHVVYGCLGSDALVSPSPPCNCIDTTQPYSKLRATWAPKLRQSIGKALRLLSAKPDWRFVAVDHRDGDQTFHEQYRRFLELEASGWKGISGTQSAVSLDAIARAFYEALMSRRSRDFDAKILLLEADARPIAGQLSLKVYGRQEVLKIAYYESYSRYSPGQVLMDEAIRRACSDGGTDTISLVTDMPWHRAWRPEPTPTVSMVRLRNRWLQAAYPHARDARRTLLAMSTRRREIRDSRRSNPRVAQR